MTTENDQIVNDLEGTLGQQDPWAGIRQLRFQQQSVERPAWSDAGYSTDAYTETFWDADRGTLDAGGFNTKYMDRPEEVAPNVFKVTVQQPGAHKYDTAEAFYAVDPETGMGTLVEDPTPTRQVSSREKWRDRLETRILPIAATILSAGYGAGALAGGTAGTAGAGAAGTTLGLTSAQWSALATAAGKGAMTSAGANALQQLRANGWDLDEVNGELVVKSAATGAVVGAIGAGVNAFNPAQYAGLEGTAGKVANKALAGGLTAAATGGNSEEILRSAAAGGVSGTGVLDLTGNADIDRAVNAGVMAEIGGRDGWEAALASGLGSAADYLGLDPSLVNGAASLVRGSDDSSGSADSPADMSWLAGLGGAQAPAPAAPPEAPKGAEMFYFGALEPGSDAGAASVTDFQGAKAAERRKSLYALPEDDDNVDAPTRIADLLRLINGTA